MMIRMSLTLAVWIALAGTPLSAPDASPGLSWVGGALSPQDAQEKGLIVERVEPGSAAEKARIEVGDRLLTYDGKPLTSPAKLKALEENTFGPESVELRLVRGDERLNLQVPLRSLGVMARPDLSPEVLKLYSEGSSLLESGAADDAIAKWTEAADLAEERGDRPSAAWLLRRIAASHEKELKWIEAMEFNLRALHLAESATDNATESEILHALGRCNLYGNRLSAADESFRKSMAINLSEEYLVWQADSLNAIGGVAYRRGEILEADEHFKRARPIYQKFAPDSIQYARCLNNIAVIAFYVGDLDAASTNYGMAYQISSGINESSFETAGILINLGLVAHDLGEPESAEDYIKRGLAIYEPIRQESVHVAIGVQSLGVLAHERFDLDAAETHYERSLRIYEKVGAEQEAAIIQANLATLAADRGNIGEAEERFEYALARVNENTLHHASVLASIGDLKYRCSDFSTAMDYHKSALAIRQKLAAGSLAVAKSLSNMGAIALAMDDLVLARQYSDAALDIDEQLAQDSLDTAIALGILARVARSEDDYQEASRLYLRVLDIIEDQRRKIYSPEARSLLMGGYTQTYGEALRTMVMLTDVPSAFEILERARARSLVDQIRESRVDFTSDAPQELIEEQEKLDKKQASAYSMLAKLAGTADSPKAEGLRAEILNLKVQQRQLDAEFRRQSPRYASIKYPHPLDLEGAQAALEEGTLLLSYFVDEEETYLFTLMGGERARKERDYGLTLFRIEVGAEDLQQRVNAFRAAIIGRSPMVRQGKELYDLLVRPAESEIGEADRVLICPDGPLHILPFSALVSEQDPRSLESARFFGEVKPLHTIVSMTVYAETRRQREDVPREHKYELLAFANPDYRAYGPESNLIPLSSSEEEVLAILNLYGDRTAKRVQDRATEAEVMLQAPLARMLHFACHGFLDDEDPLASYLALTPSGEDDGLLQAWEIFERLRLNADLVVLSACKTGLGETTKHEGVIGLTRALQYAGARSIVVSLWSVQASSTTELMKTFYTEMKAGAPKDVALQRAMVAVRKETKWRHPFYWAPFQLVGDPR